MFAENLNLDLNFMTGCVSVFSKFKFRIILTDLRFVTGVFSQNWLSAEPEILMDLPCLHSDTIVAND